MPRLGHAKINYLPPSMRDHSRASWLVERGVTPGKTPYAQSHLSECRFHDDVRVRRHIQYCLIPKACERRLFRRDHCWVSWWICAQSIRRLKGPNFRSAGGFHHTAVLRFQVYGDLARWCWSGWGRKVDETEDQSLAIGRFLCRIQGGGRDRGTACSSRDVQRVRLPCLVNHL